MSIYGYARVSTHRQVISRQITNILRYDADAIIYSESFTGTTANRPEWKKLLKTVQTGDTIIFDSVSRMSRNADEGIEEYFKLYDKGVTLVFLNEPYINTETYSQALQQSITTTGNEIADLYIEATNKVLKILAEKQIEQAFEQSEKEVKDLQKRTKEGMKSKEAGLKISKARQGKTYETDKSKKIKSVILKHCKDFGGSLKDTECMELCGCTVGTYYKYKKILLEESGQLIGQQKIC